MIDWTSPGAAQAVTVSLSPIEKSLLVALSGSRARSRDELCRELGVSMQTLAAAFGSLACAGVTLTPSDDALQSGGTVRALDFDLLDIDAVRRELSRAQSTWRLDHDVACESTNSALLQRARSASVHACALSTDFQYAGRGRQGRRWVTRPGQALTFSVGWSMPMEGLALSGLSLAVGAATAECLRASGLREVSLKWPNDLLVRDAKLGGILVEALAARGVRECVTGIGLNWHLPDEPAIDRPVAALDSRVTQGTTREALFARLLLQLERALDLYATVGFAGFRERWNRFHVQRGRLVEVRAARGEPLRGIALDVDETGALGISTASGIVRVHTGELESAGA